MSKGSLFTTMAKAVSRFAGGPLCFGLVLTAVVVWAATGPVFDYSNNWQLVINTSTSIITLLMVFLIQCSQNRDSEAVQIKLDELIRATHGARNALLDLEELDPDQLAKFRASYLELAERAKVPTDATLHTGTPDVKLDGLPQTGGDSADGTRGPEGTSD